MPKDFGRRLPVDTRMIEEIQRSPTMRAEQDDWLSGWGGPSGYTFWAKQPVEDRLTYFAVSEGFNTTKDIADATGLRECDVNKSLSKLESVGLVEAGQVTK